MSFMKWMSGGSSNSSSTANGTNNLVTYLLFFHIQYVCRVPFLLNNLRYL